MLDSVKRKCYELHLFDFMTKIVRSTRSFENPEVKGTVRNENERFCANISLLV